jgi:Tol biopolymer transport system component
MTSDDRFEQLLADVLAEAAPMREPDRLVPEIIRAARREHRRPRWLVLLKEPPMRLSSRVAVGSPTFRLASIMALTLALVLALGAAVAVGASMLPSPPPQVPPPFGPAANGAVAYAQDGAIRTVDARGDNPTLITTGADQDDSPGFSPDGTKIAFIRHGGGTPTLMVARADGSDPVEVMPAPDSLWVNWMPDSARFRTTQAAGTGRRLSIVDAVAGGHETTLDLQGIDPGHWVTARPPDGSELIFWGHASGTGAGQVYAIGADGSGLRQVGSLPYQDNVFMDPDVSPDGTTVAYWDAEATRDPRTADGFPDASLHLLDLDTGIDREVQLDESSRAEKKPAWSPDGASLAFYSVERNQVVIAPVDGSGPATPIGRVFSSPDGLWFGFSPDGRVLMESVSGAGPTGSGETTFYDVATGEVISTLATDVVDWQRLAAP